MQALVHAIMQLCFNICIIMRANYLESFRLLICIYIAYGYNHYSICNQCRVHNIPRYMQAILTCTFKLLLSIHLSVFLYCDIFGKIQICVIIIKFMYTVVTLSRKISITYKTPALEIIGLRYIIILVIYSYNKLDILQGECTIFSHAEVLSFSKTMTHVYCGIICMCLWLI
jgi:hypothetical protein